MKRVFYASPLVPSELIRAHGFLPMMGAGGSFRGSGPVPDAAGVCAFLRAFVNEACASDEAAAVVLTTECDQMRRGGELAAVHCDVPLFLMDVPATRGAPAVQAAYVGELRRLGRFLVALGGTRPSDEDIWDAMAEADQSRRTSFPSVALVEGVPLALLGGHVSGRNGELAAEIERCGGRIVLDGTDRGARTRPAPLRARSAPDDPYDELARVYFDALPTVCERPNERLYDWLRAALAESGARGLVLLRYVWCDLWHAELAELERAFDLPVLDIDLCGEELSPRNRTRVQALIEALQVRT